MADHAQKIQENEKYVIEEIKLINNNIAPAIDDHIKSKMEQIEDRSILHIENKLNQVQ